MFIDITLSQREKDGCVLLAAFILGISIYFLGIDFSPTNWVEEANTQNILYLFNIGFFITLIGNGSFLLPIPYAAVIPLLAGYLPTHYYKILLGFTCGIAAGIGEMTAYGLGFLSRTQLSEESKENLEYLKNQFSSSSPILLFLAGLLPIPDEFIIAPLASAGYPFQKMITFTMLGKILLCIFLSGIVGPIFGIAIAYGGNSRLFSSAIAVAFLLLFYLFIRIDWKELL